MVVPVAHFGGVNLKSLRVGFQRAFPLTSNGGSSGCGDKNFLRPVTRSGLTGATKNLHHSAPTFTQPKSQGAGYRVTMAPSSSRRFDLGNSNQPIIQFIASTLPFFFLLIWFLYSAGIREGQPCYQNGDPTFMDDDSSRSELYDQCNSLVPLKQYVYIFLGMAFLWSLLATYLVYYVPRRHALTQAYLTQGQVVIGDVYFNRKKRVIGALSSYGSAIYPHPEDATTMLKRRVRVFERYTRERAAIVYLPGMPYSGQPKLDLEIDRDVTELNNPRLEILVWYAFAWALFCLLAPLYVLRILNKLDANYEGVWLPDVDVNNFPFWYYISAFLIVPVVVVVWNVLAWYMHKRWMTNQHRVMQDGEPIEQPGCCFDDDECESIEVGDYQPPTAQAVQRDGALA